MTPAETARNEAAKQAVMFAFAILGTLAMIPFYKKMTDHQARAALNIVRPAEAAQQRMQAAHESAKRWDRVASVLFTFGTQRSFWWAHDKAERARAAYEAERP